MNKAAKKLAELLIQLYGPLLSIKQLAVVLKRSPNGLRISLLKDDELTRQFNQARKKFGRRVYFLSETVAEIIADGSKERSH